VSDPVEKPRVQSVPRPETSAATAAVAGASGRSSGLPFGAQGHPLSPVEAGRRGGIRSGEVRREQGKTVRERLREKIEADVELIWKAFEAGLRSDDDRAKLAAAIGVLAEAYGRPSVQVVGDAERPVSFRLVSAFAPIHAEAAVELDGDVIDAETLELEPGEGSA
jgi:hypothetical protein